ncbi:4-(cytidine 5'-diphospho)-2-C-methyl-D-erythritol kinase [Candidatus Pelagibacter bacterium]|nr:4-(cytidine 5'-diphospho)-2-C-methyl-D-erythritol kinase [Candidatus Pelagibacter bacterium]MDA9618982.1 4-(cytidine 5'-diphospho)-2-C-methyl-D-erythritol kinase [Candidatus Pelagibacter bacterium]
MVLSSYAKINLSLRINSKRKNGLHEIQSYFCLINLADKIKLKKIKEKKDKIFFKGPFSKSVNKKNNSIINLFKLLRKLKLISNYYSVTINKNIPVFGGLGGGTGNAASIIKVLLKGKVSKSLLNKAESIIGTDLRLFFYKQGFLSNLKTITHFQKKKLFFILIKPSVKCSTREIYSKVRKYSKKRLLAQNKINTKNKFISVLSRENNDLQSIVEKKYPLIKKLLLTIRNEKGCYFSRMTGSGSVCYGLFKDQITAKKALNKLKIKFPKFWFSFAKTV